ncbi:MAG: glycosyltransferase family 2 protein [Deltaproteobacteria bacterium]|nr:glycosyltransferase family 2 protein [Deltaproteobacteria bacterium]
MSNLRIVGLFIGIIGLLSTFLFYRGPKWKRSNFVLLSFFNICLILVSINPNLVNFIRDTFSLQESYRGRIIGLLIISIIFLLFYSFYTKSQVENIRLQLDGVIRELGVNYLQRDIKLSEEIKPIMVLIPAYNEAENLKELLLSIPTHIDGIEVGILVIDDGSEDDTLTVASRAGVWVTRNPVNRGGGAALRVGYDILKRAGAQICVTMDGDGQHQPEEMHKLILPIIEGNCDLVIGSRVLGHVEQYSFIRLIGVYIFGALISFLLGKKITDPSSGFRAFTMDCLSEISLYEDQYHTSELIISAVRNGKKLEEVPITIRRRKHGKSKKGRDWGYGINFAKTIIHTWWRK